MTHLYYQPHPVAVIQGFMAVRNGATVDVSWTSALEENTSHYLVQGAPSFTGAFVTLNEVGTNSNRSYTTTITSSSSVFRLVEVESTGDTLVYPADSLCAAPTQIDRTVEVEADSLQLLFEFQGLVVDTTYADPVLHWACIAPDAYVEAAQPLATYWRGKGYKARVVSFSELGGVQNIKAFIQNRFNFGLKYVLLAGDANDYAYYTNQTLWSYAGWGYPGWATQGAKNVIPAGSYTVDVNPPNKGMPAYTPYWASDWSYGDVDNDGLADVAIGRAPVLSSSDMTYFVAKTLNALARQWTVPILRTSGHDRLVGVMG